MFTSYYYLIGTTEHGTKKNPRWVGLGGIIKKRGSNMKNAIPQGITVIYFDDKSKNIYADMPPNKEQAKRLSKRIYKDAMTAVSAEQASGKALAPACD